jgi:excisionase family DNA binding protein
MLHVMGIDDWLTVAAAAERFRVNRERLERAARKGTLPATKLGDGRTMPWLVKADDVAAYLAQNRPGPKPSLEGDSPAPAEE